MHRRGDRPLVERRVLAQRKGEVLVDRERVEERAALEHHPELLADAVQLTLGEARDVLTGDEDVPRLRADEPADQAQDRALARAAAAEDHRHLARRERAREAAEHLAVAERHVDALQRDVDVGAGGVGCEIHRHVIESPPLDC